MIKMICSQINKRVMGQLTTRPVAKISRIPNFTEKIDPSHNSIFVIDKDEAEKWIPDYKLKDFKDKKTTKVH